MTSRAPIDYWVMRTIRRHMPQRIVDFMLDRRIYIKPGKDTGNPGLVANNYRAAGERLGKPIAGQRVCVVGFGGSFGVGLHLLENGAKRVILQDPFAPERSAHNANIPGELMKKYFSGSAQNPVPNPERIEVTRERLEEYAALHPSSVDLIVSNSVLEHVMDLPSLVAASGKLMAPDGASIHFVDLRDHYFKYPFEMLRYSHSTWTRWLNASNHLNRLRTNEYENVFQKFFADVEVQVTENLEAEFLAMKSAIRAEFLTGDDRIDSASAILVTAQKPL